MTLSRSSFSVISFFKWTQLCLLVFLMGCNSGSVNPMIRFNKAQPFNGIGMSQFPSEFEGDFLLNIYENKDELPDLSFPLVMMSRIFKEQPDQSSFQIIVHLKLNPERTKLRVSRDMAISSRYLDFSMKKDSMVITNSFLGRENDTLRIAKVDGKKLYLASEDQGPKFMSQAFNQDFVILRLYDKVDEEPPALFPTTFDLVNNEMVLHYTEDENGNKSEAKLKLIAKQSREDSTIFFNLNNYTDQWWVSEAYKLENNGNITRYFSTSDGMVDKKSAIDSLFSVLGLQFTYRGYYENTNEDETIDPNDSTAIEPDSVLDKIEYEIDPTFAQFKQVVSNPLLFNVFELRRIQKESPNNYSFIPISVGLILLLILVVVFISRRRKSEKIPEEVKSKILKAIEAGNLENSFKVIKSSELPSKFLKRTRLIEYQFQSAKQKFYQNTITYEDFNVEEAKITASLLNIFG